MAVLLLLLLQSIYCCLGLCKHKQKLNPGYNALFFDNFPLFFFPSLFFFLYRAPFLFPALSLMPTIILALHGDSVFFTDELESPPPGGIKAVVVVFIHDPWHIIITSRSCWIKIDSIILLLYVLLSLATTHEFCESGLCSMLIAWLATPLLSASPLRT